MSFLIPPRLVALLLMIAGPLGLLVPIVGPLTWPIRLIGIVPICIGLALTVTSAQHFDRIGTNIKTFRDPDQLVADGSFRYSRNPIYPGFLLMLIGVAVLIGSLSAWVAPIGFWIAGQFWYIPFEEQRMVATFGAGYEQYQQQVRRWIGTR